MKELQSRPVSSEVEQQQEVFTDLSVDELLSHAVRNKEGVMPHENGPLYVDTRPDTGRSPKDAYVVVNEASEHVDFSGASKPMTSEQFTAIRDDVSSYLDSQPRTYIQNLQVGADETISIRLQTETAPAALFLRNLLRVPEEGSEVPEPEYTLLHAPQYKLDKEKHGTSSDRGIIIDFDTKTVIIAGTKYFGEEKKSFFKVGQYEYPKKGILTMHCSANEGENGETALFFGLSGTGKTTLSTDETRKLIGDDEHGWSESGIFNFEDGSYAKGIELTEESEPIILQASMSRGSVGENIERDPSDNSPILTKAAADAAGIELVENMRFAFPLSAIKNASETGRGKHPEHIILLTASDVMPPVARLSNEEAVYHFLSGYTSKMPGTEIGLTSPKPEFSAGYGHPFLIYEPAVYAEMFYRNLQKHGSHVWMMNTGWPDGFENKRMSLKDTRALVNKILRGEMEEMQFEENELGFQVPVSVEGIDRDFTQQSSGWSSNEEFWTNAEELVINMTENFKKFEGKVPQNIASAGPRLVRA